MSTIDIARSAAEHAVAAALTRFYHYLDRSEYGGCVACFAQDGRWRRLGVLHSGRDAIARVLEARPETIVVRHILSNLLIDIETADQARVAAYVTVYGHNFAGGPPTLPAPLNPPLGIYSLDVMMSQTKDAWLITNIEMSAQFLRPKN